MRYVIWGIVGLIVLGVAVVGGGGYYLANVEVDFRNPETVANFKQTYTSNCVSTYKQRLTKAGAAPSSAQLANAESACDCARDPIVDAFAKRPAMTVSELAGLMDSDPEITGITKTCSDQFGIANPS